MDLLKKVETLLNAKTRSVLPRRERHSILDKQEEAVLAEIRQALGNVEATERELVKRIKTEQAEAKQAAKRGDRAEQRAHQRRADELEHRLDEESIFAINLEEKLAALENKLALAKEAVEKEARNVAARDEEAEKAMAQSSSHYEADVADFDPAVDDNDIIDDDFIDDEPDLAARKSRLSG